MKLIADAGVIAKALIPETDTDKARALLGGWLDGRITFLAPDILPAEIASILWKRVRRNVLPVHEAARLYAEFARLGIPLAPLEDLVPAALEFALRNQQSVYDGLYLALAHQAHSILVTADARLWEAAQGKLVKVLLLKDLSTKWLELRSQSG